MGNDDEIENGSSQVVVDVKEGEVMDGRERQ